MPLEEELDFFEQKRPELLKTSQGKFVLIKGHELIGFYDSPENAYMEGINRFGNVPFLIKQILSNDQPVVIPALSVEFPLRANP